MCHRKSWSFVELPCSKPTSDKRFTAAAGMRRPPLSSHKPMHTPPTPPHPQPRPLTLSTEEAKPENSGLLEALRKNILSFHLTFFGGVVLDGWSDKTQWQNPIFWRGKLFSFCAICQSWPDSSNLSHWSKAKTAPCAHTARPARGVKTFFHPRGVFFVWAQSPALSGGIKKALCSAGSCGRGPGGRL